MVNMQKPQQVLDRMWQNISKGPEVNDIPHEVSQLLVYLLAALAIVDPVKTTDGDWEQIDFTIPTHAPSRNLRSFLISLRNGLAHRQWEPINSAIVDSNGVLMEEFTAIEFWTIHTSGPRKGEINFRCPQISKNMLREIFDLLTTMDHLHSNTQIDTETRRNFTEFCFSDNRAG